MLKIDPQHELQADDSDDFDPETRSAMRRSAMLRLWSLAAACVFVFSGLLFLTWMNLSPDDESIHNAVIKANFELDSDGMNDKAIVFNNMFGLMKKERIPVKVSEIFYDGEDFQFKLSDELKVFGNTKAHSHVVDNIALELQFPIDLTVKQEFTHMYPVMRAFIAACEDNSRLEYAEALLYKLGIDKKNLCFYPTWYKIETQHNFYFVNYIFSPSLTRMTIHSVSNE